MDSLSGSLEVKGSMLPGSFLVFLSESDSLDEDTLIEYSWSIVDHDGSAINEAELECDAKDDDAQGECDSVFVTQKTAKDFHLETLFLEAN